MKQPDFRARTTAESFNELAKAVNRCNKVISYFGLGESSGYVVYMRLKYDTAFVYADFVPILGTGGGASFWGVTRGALYKKTLTTLNAAAIHGRAAEYRWSGRGGFIAWGNGWDGTDTSNVTAADLSQGDVALPFSSPVTTYSPFTQSGPWVYMADPYAGFDHPDLNPALDPTSPDYDPSLFVDGVGAVPWDVAGRHSQDILNGDNSLNKLFFHDSPGAANGPGWTAGKVAGIALYERLPLTLEGSNFGGQSTVGANDYYFIPALGMTEPEIRWNTVVDFIPDLITWPRPMRRFPDGTTINEAKLEVTIAGLQKTRYQWAQHAEADGTLVVDVDTYETTADAEGLTLALLGRKLSSDSKLAIWEPIGLTVEFDLEADKQGIVDVKELMQAFLDTHRKSEYSHFAWMPAVYQSLLTVTDGRGFLEASMPSVVYDSWLDPAWDGGPHNIYGGNDKIFLKSADGSFVTWTGVSTGKLYLDWTYPDGEKGQSVLYFNVPPMSDL